MLRWAQQAARIANQVLENHGRLAYLEGAWIPNVQDGLITIIAKMVLTKLWVVKSQQEGDMMIMDIFHANNSLIKT
eukprot:4546156-Ditylum_brightwellii.AAC.1